MFHWICRHVSRHVANACVLIMLNVHLSTALLGRKVNFFGFPSRHRQSSGDGRPVSPRDLVAARHLLRIHTANEVLESMRCRGCVSSPAVLETDTNPSRAVLRVSLGKMADLRCSNDATCLHRHTRTSS